MEEHGQEQEGMSAGARTSGGLSLNVSIGEASFSADGDGSTVLAAFAQFRDFISKLPPEAVNANKNDVAPGHDGPRSEASEPGSASAEPQSKPELAEFLQNRPSIKSNPLIATAIVVWCKRHGAKDQVKLAEVESLWGQSGRKVPGNVGAALSTAAGKGWLQKVDRGVYVANAFSEKSVDKQLEEPA